MLTPAVIIQKKRDGKTLTDEEIAGFIRGLTEGQVADYQATAFLMAVYFQGMTLKETAALTRAMLASGEHYDLSSIKGPKIDKHSTGGVGDKVSLILAPLAAACGIFVPMMSGRGLGHSGGTLDKLESIPGFQVGLSFERFKQVLEKVGCAMIGQSLSIAPADKKLYALRDVTATVECIPLIVASILSKKLAEGTEGLVLDVKVGSGAFMKSAAQGRKLAKALVQVAELMGLKCRALLTDMNQPLGYAVGNGLEVQECIEILRGKTKPESRDLETLTLALVGEMLVLGKICESTVEGRGLAAKRLKDGSAWKVFERMVEAQNGNLAYLREPERFDPGPQVKVWKARKAGYIAKMNTESIGRILIELGGGRKRASDSVNPKVGLVFHRKLGARVKSGDPLTTVYAPAGFDLGQLEEIFQDSVQIASGSSKSAPKLILESL